MELRSKTADDLSYREEMNLWYKEDLPYTKNKGKNNRKKIERKRKTKKTHRN